MRSKLLGRTQMPELKKSRLFECMNLSIVLHLFSYVNARFYLSHLILKRNRVVLNWQRSLCLSYISTNRPLRLHITCFISIFFELTDVTVQMANPLKCLWNNALYCNFLLLKLYNANSEKCHFWAPDGNRTRNFQISGETLCWTIELAVLRWLRCVHFPELG